MNLQTINISEQERKSAEQFTDEILPEDISWNDIMPIIEHIETLGFAVEIRLNYCSVIETKKDDTFLDINGFFTSSGNHKSISKIKAVWQAVIQFIKWYQQQ